MSGNEMTPKEWVVGRYDDPTLAFIGEIGGSVCVVDNLTLEQADAIVTAHNQRRIAALARSPEEEKP